MLSTSERVARAKPTVRTAIDLQSILKGGNLEWDKAETALRRDDPMLTRRVQPLSLALANASIVSSSAAAAATAAATGKSSGDTGGGGKIGSSLATAAPVLEDRDRASTKRIMLEMRKIEANPHPSVEVFPCFENIGFWRFILQAPNGSVYEGGVFLCYIKVMFKKERRRRCSTQTTHKHL